MTALSDVQPIEKRIANVAMAAISLVIRAPSSAVAYRAVRGAAGYGGGNFHALQGSGHRATFAGNCRWTPSAPTDQGYGWRAGFVAGGDAQTWIGVGRFPAYP